MPCFLPCSTSSRTCQPTRIRDSPFSFEAFDRLENRRSVGEAASQVPVSSVRLHALNARSSVPMTLAMTVAATAPSIEWPESYDGVAPVGINGFQLGSPTVSGLPSYAPPSRIAVSGRHRL